LGCIFRADENEERGIVRFYGFPGLVSQSHNSTQKSMCAITQFLCGPRAYAGWARSGLRVQFSGPPRRARIATPKIYIHKL